MDSVLVATKFRLSLFCSRPLKLKRIVNNNIWVLANNNEFLKRNTTPCTTKLDYELIRHIV